MTTVSSSTSRDTASLLSFTSRFAYPLTTVWTPPIACKSNGYTIAKERMGNRNCNPPGLNQPYGECGETYFLLSPAICQSGYTVGCFASGTKLNGVDIFDSETAALCVPSGYKCLTSRTIDTVILYAIESRLNITTLGQDIPASERVCAFQIRWASSDLALFETPPILGLEAKKSSLSGGLTATPTPSQFGPSLLPAPTYPVNNLSRGYVAGIVCGIVLAAVVAIFAVGCIVRRRQSRQPSIQAPIRLRRYIFRTAVGLLVPPILLCFYIMISLKWITYTATDVITEAKSPNADLVYYAWFISSVLALGLGEFGLAGSEAAMLTMPLFTTPHGGHILLHADRTWSGPSGWVKAVSFFWRWRTVSLPWILLSVPTILIYIAIPLSGLTMELQTGYTAGTESATVLGVNATTFNHTGYGRAIIDATQSWLVGRPERPPGRSIIYTRQPQDQIPKSLSAEGVSNIFVAPQAEDIIHGQAWGIQTSYNCSIVTRIADFALYKYRNDTSIARYPDVPNILELPINLTTSNIFGYPAFITRNWTTHQNVEARIEIATNLDIFDLGAGREYKPQTFPPLSDAGGWTREYPGMDNPVIFDVVLWQTIDEHQNESWEEGPLRNFSLDLGTTVGDLFDSSGPINFSTTAVPAIGVSCHCASAVGQARIDGIHNTFSNFTRQNIPYTPPPVTSSLENFTAQAPLWGLISPVILPQGALMVLLQVDTLIKLNELVDKAGWIEGMFSSVHAADYASVSGRGKTLLRRLTYDDLRQVVLQAFGSYLTQIMYQGSQQAFISERKSPIAWLHNDLRVAEKAPVLVEGAISFLPIIVLLTIWAFWSGYLAIMFGFQRRWSETLDSYSVFCFGTDFARHRSTEWVPGNMDTCDELRNLPGLVGDSRPRNQIGHISLSSVSLSKDKKYG